MKSVKIQVHTFSEINYRKSNRPIGPLIGPSFGLIGSLIPGLMISIVFFCSMSASIFICSRSNNSWFLSYCSSSMSARICLVRDSWPALVKIWTDWPNDSRSYQFHCNIKVL